MKKIILLFIILLSTITYSIDIIVITKSGLPLSQTLVKINHKVGISNSKGYVSLDSDNQFLNISLSKEGYSQETLTIKNTYEEKQTLTLVMKPIEVSAVTFKFSSNKGVIQYREIGSKYYTSIPFFKTLKTLSLSRGTYEFTFSSENTLDYRKIINLKNPTEFFSIDLEVKKNQFYFIGNLGVSKSINFYNREIGDIKPVKDITLVFFKNGNIVDKLKLKDTFTSISLDKGTYDIMIESKFHPNLFYRNISFNESTNNNIVLTIPSTLVKVKGTIKNDNQFIGGVKVLFSDVENNTYETISNFSGGFDISLPPQKYKIAINKPGFKVKDSQNLIYDFSNSSDTYTLDLDTEELLSNITGSITDSNNNPISTATIMIKNGDSIINIDTDEFGNFSTKVKPGLLFIKAEKKGYKSFGVVTKLERLSSISGLKIPLTPFLSSISGIISNSFNPLSGINLTLRDKEGKVIANAISNQNGYYEFPDININNQFFISIGSQIYKYYYSEPFILTKEHITNKNIILQDRNSRLYINLLDSKKKPLNKANVLINNKQYTTDTNGFLFLNVSSDSNNLEIKIKSLNYSKKIPLGELKDDPNLMTLIIK